MRHVTLYAYRRLMPLVMGLALCLDLACEPVGPEETDFPQVTTVYPGPIPDPPLGGFQIRTPIYEIGPGEEVQKCYWGTWEEDAAVNWYEEFQDPIYGHHVRMEGLPAGTGHPDGHVSDCFEDDFGTRNNLFNTTYLGLVGGIMELHDGMGVRVRAGDRWTIQSHYINVTNETLYLQEVANIGFLPLDELTRPLSTWTFASLELDLQPNTTTDVTFDCSWPTDLTVTMIMVHMHERARAFFSETQSGKGAEWQPFYNLEEWLPEWRNEPLAHRPDGGVPVSGGDIVRSTCRYYNETDEVLDFPTEMCVLEGLAWPLDEPLECEVGFYDPQ